VRLIERTNGEIMEFNGAFANELLDREIGLNYVGTHVDLCSRSFVALFVQLPRWLEKSQIYPLAQVPFFK
jgi:hypothetical protein